MAKDMSDMLRSKAEIRKAKKTQAVPQAKSKRGRPSAYSEEDPKVNMTLVVPQSRKDKVKVYALLQHTTVSELFVQWIDEHCELNL